MSHTPEWQVIPFVDNRPQSEHHTYRITPQRGPYGSMFLDDARKASAAPDMFEASLPFEEVIQEGCDDLPDDTPVSLRIGVRGIDLTLTLGHFRALQSALTKAQGLSPEGEEA